MEELNGVSRISALLLVFVLTGFAGCGTTPQAVSPAAGAERKTSRQRNRQRRAEVVMSPLSLGRRLRKAAFPTTWNPLPTASLSPQGGSEAGRVVV
jgi:hypothetical protein